MANSKEIVLRISPENNTIFIENIKDGIHSCKQISMDTLIEAIAGSVDKEKISSGLLPPNCISFAQLSKGAIEVVVTLEAGYYDVKYLQSEYLAFPLPRIAFKFVYFEGQRVQGCFIGITDLGILRPGSKMYKYPFSNVSRYNLCTGNNSLPYCKTPYTLASLPEYIISMPNNSDHFRASNNKLKLEQRDLMELLKDKTPEFYYSNILIPNGDDLKKFINSK